MKSEYVSVQVFAAKLGYSERTVRHWCETGALDAIKPGAHYRIPRRELTRVERGEPRATPETAA